MMIIIVITRHAAGKADVALSDSMHVSVCVWKTADPKCI